MTDIPTPPSARVLIVEDEALIAAELADRLRRRGFDTLGPVDTADAAVTTALAERPDLVLMDVRLKGTRDGIDAARELQSASDIPVVFLTANTDVATYRRAQITTPYGYVVKPFNERELVVAIDTALLRARREAELRRDSLTFATIAAAVADAVIVVDASHAIRYLNPAAEQLFGWSWTEVADRQRDDVLRLFETIDPAALPDATSDRRTGLIVARNGESIPVIERNTPLADAAGRSLGTVCSLTDLRDVQRLQLAQQSSEQLTDAIFVGSPTAMAVLDAHGQLLRTNTAFRHLVGTTDAMTGTSAFDLLPANIQDTFRNSMRTAPRDGSVASPLELQLVGGHGAIPLVVSRLVALPSPDGATELLLWNCLPIDAQKRLITSVMMRIEATATAQEMGLPFRTVLVVEDEPGMRHIIQRMLNRDGIVTIAVTDGVEALALLRSRSTAVDLVLTDIVMPRISGGELARTIEVEFPDLPLVFMSGYHDDIFVQDAVETAKRPLLSKPFSHDDLRHALRQAARLRTPA